MQAPLKSQIHAPLLLKNSCFLNPKKNKKMEEEEEEEEDLLIQTAKRTWSQTVTTSLVKSFSDSEWRELVNSFRVCILNHPPGSKIVGYSFTAKASALFVYSNVQKLLNESFKSESLSQSNGWVLEDCADLGVKCLYIPGEIFAERLKAHICSQKTKGEEPQKKYSPPPQKKQQVVLETDSTESEDSDNEQDNAVALKPKKNETRKRSNSFDSPSLEELVKEFMETQTTSTMFTQSLSRAEVWGRFHHWATMQKSLGGKNISFKRFCSCFEAMNPDNVLQVKTKKFYTKFYIHLKDLPRYPPNGPTPRR